MEKYKCPKRDCPHNISDICIDCKKESRHWCNNIIIKDKNVDKAWINDFLYAMFKSQIVLREFDKPNDSRETVEKKAMKYVCDVAGLYYGHETFDMC
jgi:hypothetical protein